jgi:pre-mRNA branch site protein p14
MTTTAPPRALARLPPEVNRTLYVRNLPFNVSSEDMHEIFGKYGALRQIRLGTTKATKGTAYVVYEDIHDAKQACEHLSGFNVANRYLIVLYHQSGKATQSVERRAAETARLQREHGVSGTQT